MVFITVPLSGMVSTWSIDAKGKSIAQSSTYGSNHQSPISVLKWNNSGKRLVTGDRVRVNVLLSPLIIVMVELIFATVERNSVCLGR